MNKPFILLFISISVACLGQNKKEITTTAKATVEASNANIKPVNPTFSLEKTIIFSKGEAFTEKEWQDYRKQMLPLVKQFFQRDSVHNKFLGNTVAPHLMPSDTIETYSVTSEGIHLKFKPHRNGKKTD